jgi:hypothetical protein
MAIAFWERLTVGGIRFRWIINRPSRICLRVREPGPDRNRSDEPGTNAVELRMRLLQAVHLHVAVVNERVATP